MEVGTRFLRCFRPRRAQRIPTDIELLEHIHTAYKEEFEDFRENKVPKRRPDVNWVQLNVNEIGDVLNSDGDIIYGRLEFH